jgi:hypothetical protein
MIKINKQLQRPDKGTLSAGSIIDYTTNFNGDKKIVRFNLTHWFNELAKEKAKEDGWLPVQAITNFIYIQLKECTDEEWASLNDAGSAEMVELWLKDIIDAEIGNGSTEII